MRGKRGREDLRTFLGASNISTITRKMKRRNPCVRREVTPKCQKLGLRLVQSHPKLVPLRNSKYLTHLTRYRVDQRPPRTPPLGDPTVAATSLPLSLPLREVSTSQPFRLSSPIAIKVHVGLATALSSLTTFHSDTARMQGKISCTLPGRNPIGRGHSDSCFRRLDLDKIKAWGLG